VLMALTAHSVTARSVGSHHSHDEPSRVRRTRQPEPLLSERGSVATPGAGGSGATEVSREERRRFSVGTATVIGALMLLASGSFIGHTASESPRLLIAASDFAHVAAASIWAGGAVALASTLRRRRRSGSGSGSALLTARFSVSATWSLVLVAATGAAMAWTILPEPSALWSSTFGRILLLKVLLVVAIAAVGAYNHFALVPAIRDGADGDTIRNRLRATLSAELVGFVAVIAATAALVGASPT
jgi:copper transport protein